MQLRTIILCLILCLQGCGYGLQGSGSVLPPDVRRIYIPMVENNSTKTVLTSMVTESLRERFDRYGVVTVVDEAASADAILYAKILKLGRDVGTSSSKSDDASLLDAKLYMSAELQRVSGEVLWKDPQFVVSRSYGSNRDVVVTTSSSFATGSIGAANLAGLSTREVSRDQEHEALTTLADLVAKMVYDQSVAPDF